MKSCHAEEVTVWKDTSRDNTDGLIKDMKVAKAKAAKMSVDQNLILVRYEEHVRGLQDMVNLNEEHKLTFIDAMA